MSFVVEPKPYSNDRKSSKSALFEDGKGGTQSTPDMKAGACYIYYRLYAKDGPLDCNSPIYSNDRSISRISSTSVRPPQTAASLKRYLCKIEGLGAFKNCTLYQSLSEKMAMEDSTRLSFRGTPGPGSSEFDPMALVADTHASEKRSQAASTGDPQELPERDYEQHYVYYRVYDEDGETVSKTSFGNDSPSLGRVGTLFIPPPYTVSSLRYHLTKSEGISCHNVQIFEDEGSEFPMDDCDAIPLLSDAFPGFIEDRPIAIAYESGGNISPFDGDNLNENQARDLYEARSELGEPKISNETHALELAQVREELEKAKQTHAYKLREARSSLEESQKSNEAHVRELAEVRKELEKGKETHAREMREARSALARLREELKKLNEAHARELREARRSTALIQALAERPSFTKKIKATTDDNNPDDPTWHSMKTGDIFFTDGISRRGGHSHGREYNCYLAISSSGKLAFAFQDKTVLC